MRTFTYSDAKSHKFWNIDLQGDKLTVTYGRIGAAGQTQTKQFKGAAAAQKEHDKLVKEKLAKGYQETTPSARPQPRSMREALEEALAASPEDLASHMAYADWLSEQPAPADQARGEFIRVQLALEDEGKPAAERKKLQEQEKKLLKAHAREWLGELAAPLLESKKKGGGPGDDLECKYQFARGWLDSLEASWFNVAFTRLLARSPQIRLLRRLALIEDAYQEEGEWEPGPDVPDGVWNPALYPLVRCPYLGNVRVLQLGERTRDDPSYFNCHIQGEAAVGIVKRLPRLEELYLLAHHVDCNQLFDLKTLDNLRVLQVYHNDNYPLARLAKNPSLGKLTHLLCHPHAMDEEEPYIRLPGLRAVVRSTTLPSLTHLQLRLSDFGDKGASEIVASGVLRRLKMLDLRGGTVTDKGAQELAACPDLRNLESLNLDRNCLTAKGIAALKKAGVCFTAKGQWGPASEESDFGGPEYLYEGDIE
jgi:uncharacterized protein (TIGR02996 family)